MQLSSRGDPPDFKPSLKIVWSSAKSIFMAIISLYSCNPVLFRCPAASDEFQVTMSGYGGVVLIGNRIVIRVPLPGEDSISICPPIRLILI